jgi:Zn-dependent peptidase ImmA (M78 family)
MSWATSCLHRSQRPSFSCDKESVYSGADRHPRSIEREADDFASNLLMPCDLLRDCHL